MISIADLTNEGVNQFRNLFDLFGPTNIFLSIIFMIFFLLIFKALSKVFKNKNGEPNNGIGGIIALALALLITWGINRIGLIDSLNPDGVFNYLGYSDGILAGIMPLIIIIVLIFLLIKIGPIIFIASGIFMVIISFTGYAYQSGAIAVFGIFLIIIGLIWWRRRVKKKREREWRLLTGQRRPGIFKRGWDKSRGKIGMKYNQYKYRRMKRKKANIADELKWQNKETKNTREAEEKRRKEQKKGRRKKEKSKNGKEILIKEAKMFNKWAKTTKNPKFYGSWAMFVSRMSKYGRGEKQICENLGVSRHDFVKIFNKYGIVK